MIAPRFATAVCVLLALALIPTIIHSYAGVVVEDGRRASALPETLAGFKSRLSERSATWGQRRFESHDWVERLYTTPVGDVRVTVIRSYDLKGLYHHPELAVSYGTSFEKARLEALPERPDIPVHVLETGLDSGPVAFYVLHYDERFVSDPIWFQIRTAGEMLFRGRRAMTLFFVRQQNLKAGASLAEQPSIVLLHAAIQQFVAAPLAP